MMQNAIFQVAADVQFWVGVAFICVGCLLAFTSTALHVDVTPACAALALGIFMMVV